MKLIIAIIQPNKLEDVKKALQDVEVVRLTIMDCQGFGRQKGQAEVLYKRSEFTVNLLRKVQLMIAVNEAFVEPTINAIIKGGRTGATGTEADPSSDVDRESRAAASASIALLESSLTPAKDAPLSGRAISLAEVLGRGSSHEQKFEIAELYWRLALAIANLNWAVDESKQLEALPAGQGAIDAPLLTTARAAAQARMLEAKALAVAAPAEVEALLERRAGELRAAAGQVEQLRSERVELADRIARLAVLAARQAERHELAADLESCAAVQSLHAAFLG